MCGCCSIRQCCLCVWQCCKSCSYSEPWALGVCVCVWSAVRSDLCTLEYLPHPVPLHCVFIRVTTLRFGTTNFAKRIVSNNPSQEEQNGLTFSFIVRTLYLYIYLPAKSERSVNDYPNFRTKGTKAIVFVF